MAAVGTVTLALVLYGIGTVKAQRARRATAGALGFLTAGVGADIVATGLMVVATGSFASTLHGWLGYSALTVMLIEVVLLWRHAAARGQEPIPAGQHLYGRLAYAWWVVAYFTGAALVMAQKHAAG
jgi:hypothetical protein